MGPCEAIRAALLHDWDPIGVSDVPEAQDEYDSYVWQVWQIMAQHRPRDQLVDYLHWVETDYMCLTGNHQRAERVAERLIQLWSEIEAQT